MDKYSGDERAGAVGVRRAREARDVDYLIASLETGTQLGKLQAARALGDLRVQSSVEPLLRCTRDADFWLRAAAVVALGQIGDVGTNDEISEMGKHDESPLVRFRAAEALYAVNDARATAVLIAAATCKTPKDRSWTDRLAERGFRRAALSRLVQLGLVEAIPALEIAARNGGVAHRIRLRRTIRRLSR